MRHDAEDRAAASKSESKTHRAALLGRSLQRAMSFADTLEHYSTVVLSKAKVRACDGCCEAPTLLCRVLCRVCRAHLARALCALVARAQVIFHYGFIPAIIILGMRTEPRPSLAQLLGPM